MRITRRTFVKGVGSAMALVVVPGTYLATSSQSLIGERGPVGFPARSEQWRPRGFTVEDVRRTALSVRGVREVGIARTGLDEVTVQVDRNETAVLEALEEIRPMSAGLIVVGPSEMLVPMKGAAFQ